jgi:hypothetical protein
MIARCPFTLIYRLRNGVVEVIGIVHRFMVVDHCVNNSRSYQDEKKQRKTQKQGKYVSGSSSSHDDPEFHFSESAQT